MKRKPIIIAALIFLLINTIGAIAAPPLKVLINGRPNNDPSLVRIINGLPYVSIGAISNELNLDFDYNSETSTMYIANKGKPQSKVVATLKKANAVLYATESEGNLEKFIIDINGKIVGQFNWKSVDSPTYGPRLFFEDINQDGQNELVVILTTSYGTGILTTEAHVFHKINTNAIYLEKLIDNPIAIIKKNVITNQISNNQVEITIGQKKAIDKINPYAKGEHLEYSIYNNRLVAYVSGQLKPAPEGAILITYEFKDDMYQAQSIEYVKNQPDFIKNSPFQ
ncbi:MAG: hypothetical protein K0R09_3565 [Clostridiales bacterium]|jgi:hypothetical protein|nr:hypothetical protein [Clostridiales bacterium]